MKKAKWSQEKRLTFIDFRLYWERQINRSDLTDFFKISIPQASLDIAKYNETAPGNAVYDASAKVYRSSGNFKPAFAAVSTDQYLADLLALNQKTLPIDDTFIGWQPSYSVVPRPTRSVPSDILLTLIQSIRQQRMLKVKYLSKKDTSPIHRDISPHAIAHDGQRWHVRAYCHINDEFRDFVIARFIKATISEEGGVAADNDKAWFNILKLVLTPDPQLSEAHKKALAHEYGMSNQELTLECRQALLFYIERQLGFHRGENRDPNEYPLTLKINDSLTGYLTYTK